MSETTTSSRRADGPVDPVFIHSRREALVILAVWGTCLVWSVTYCWLNGFTGAAGVETVLGVPSWVFWGIAVPWLLADLFTAWFCFFYMQDDDLGEPPPEGDEALVARIHADLDEEPRS